MQNNTSFQDNKLMEGLIGSPDTFVISTAFQFFTQTWSRHHFQNSIKMKQSEKSAIHYFMPI